MRLGLGRRLSPEKLIGYGLVAAGGFVVLLAVPLYFWAAATGGILAYLGLTILRQR